MTANIANQNSSFYRSRLPIGIITPVAGALSLIAGWWSPPLLAGSAELRVVMSGLDQPRGLAVGSDGSLYVAEAGTGGTQPCFDHGPTGPTFYGLTGGVSRLRHGVQEKILAGLPSASDPVGFVLAGPFDLRVRGGDNVEVLMGLSNDPGLRVQCGPVGAIFGTLVHFTPNEKAKQSIDVASYEAAVNPDGGIVESNPYGLLDDKNAIIVADAGGNSLLEVGPNGRIKTLAVFPSRATGRGVDSVPTCVAKGPDGAYYIGELTGLPFLPGLANVYRLVPGGRPTVFLSGFTGIIDIAFAPDGSLYVLEFATGMGLSGPGALIRVAPDGSRTTVASQGLITPTSVAVAADGTIYVSNCGVFPGNGDAPCHGHVVRIDG